MNTLVSEVFSCLFFLTLSSPPLLLSSSPPPPSSLLQAHPPTQARLPTINSLQAYLTLNLYATTQNLKEYAAH